MKKNQTDTDEMHRGWGPRLQADSSILHGASPWILKEMNMKTSEPLTDIFKSSPDLGEILEDLKAANMTMLFQKGQDRSKRTKKNLWTQESERSLTQQNLGRRE